jgi:hypothetical protein
MKKCLIYYHGCWGLRLVCAARILSSQVGDELK